MSAENPYLDRVWQQHYKDVPHEINPEDFGIASRSSEALVADSSGMNDRIYVRFLEAVKQTARWGGAQLVVEGSEEISLLLQPL